ncbi:4-phosphoerythronate dehydrogenase [Legionella israelensis]|uniref:4-phosphoerythronate dehydrogenase n=1 Tax=Legionella israelensis TaxID=454 RepID=A0AAX1EFZ1_9GAMM|nr:4-phosphoerythronate dehydrogenase [Legionella israelensis]QBR83925.1 4-phosphoerythronate dehydrogenase [Legionella israelensis]
MKIIADATLPALSQAFPKPFQLCVYHDRKELQQRIKNQDILLCRSTLKVDAKLLDNCPVKCIATASSGIDHIDIDYLHEKKISLLSAKGSNATAVADYVMSSVAYLKKNKWPGGKTAGVIGIGEVGRRVSQRLSTAGFNVLQYDPPKALSNFSFQTVAMEELFQCDLICVHAHLHNEPPYPSQNLLNKAFFDQLKTGTVIINASRGCIVNERDLLQNQRELIYCVDVYENEPDINKDIVFYASLCTPHIAGHSLEAKFEAVASISRQLHQKAGLTPPVYDYPQIPPVKSFASDLSWEDIVLSLYDPSRETQELKQAMNLKEPFLQLRKNHHFRHNFNVYSFHGLNSQCKGILGIKERE